MQFQTRCTPAGWPVFSKQVQQLSECTGWLLGLAVLLITGCPKKSNFQIECSWCTPSITNICPPPSQMDVDEPVSGNNFVGRFLLKPSRIKALAFDYKYQASQLIAQHSTVSFILINDQNFGILLHLLQLIHNHSNHLSKSSKSTQEWKHETNYKIVIRCNVYR